MSRFWCASFPLFSGIDLLHCGTIQSAISLAALQGCKMTAHPEVEFFSARDRQIASEAESRRKTLPRKKLRLMLYAELAAFDIFALIAGPLLASEIVYLLGFRSGNFLASAAVLLVFLGSGIARGAYSHNAISSALTSVRKGLIALANAVFI